MSKIDNLFEHYFDPLSQKDANRIYFQIFTAESVQKSQEAFKKHSRYISDLQSRFRQLVVERNKLAKKAGFSNFFEYMYKWDGIPDKNLTKLNRTSLEKTKKIIKNLPSIIKKTDWFNTIFNSFNYEAYLSKQTKNDPQKEAISFLKKNNLLDNTKLDKINLLPNTKGTYGVDCNNDDKTVTLHFDKTNLGITGTLSLVHEFAHALFCLSCFEDAADPNTKSSYEHEYYALELESKYRQTLYPWKACFSCNLSVKKSRYIFFDENYYGWGNEDWELAYRLFHKGFRPTYLKDAIAYHLESPPAITNAFRTHKQEDIIMNMRNVCYFYDKCPGLDLKDAFFGFIRFELDKKTNKWKILPRPDSYTTKELRKKVQFIRDWLKKNDIYFAKRKI